MTRAYSLASDERFLTFSPHDDAAPLTEADEIEPVDLCRIVGVDTEGEGNGEVSTLTLRIRESPSADEFELIMEPPQEPSKKPSVQWINAFKKVGEFTVVFKLSDFNWLSSCMAIWV